MTGYGLVYCQNPLETGWDNTPRFGKGPIIPCDINNYHEQYIQVQKKLVEALVSNLYKGDEEWVKDGELIGLPNKEFISKPDYGLSGQRGGRWPPPIGK